MSDPLLLVGLGNPGPGYERTRHNIGFMVLDALARDLGATFRAHRWDAETARSVLEGHDLLLVKPLTFMNRSGDAVVRFRDYFRIPMDRILVAHDDLDLPPGRIKVVARGGAGGHKGIRSLISRLGGQDFARIKIGIGRPGSGSTPAAMPVERFVLAALPPEEEEIMEQAVERAVEGIRLFVRQGVQECMNQLNRRS